MKWRMPRQNNAPAVRNTTITMIHSPDGSIPISAKISWEDEENTDQLRPESVTLRLSQNSQEINSANVTGSDGWTHSFGDFPVYVDGEKAEYTIAEDDIKDYSIVSRWTSSKTKAGRKSLSRSERCTQRNVIWLT